MAANTFYDLRAKLTIIAFLVTSSATADESLQVETFRKDVELEENMLYFYNKPLSFRKVADYQPIRITTFHRKDVSQYPVLVQLVDKVVKFLSNALYVQPIERPVVLSRECIKSFELIDVGNGTKELRKYCNIACEPITGCGYFALPESHLDVCRFITIDGNNETHYRINGTQGDGISNTDFVLYTTLLPAWCPKYRQIGEASLCARESSLDRPIAGSLSLCEGSIMNRLNAGDAEAVVKIIKHELLHSLVFARMLYPFYRSPTGVPLSPRDANLMPLRPNEAPFYGTYAWSSKVIVTREGLWKTRKGFVPRNFTYIVLPKVREEARKHFGCDSLPGAELEDQGSEGNFWEHWEYRAFKEELMTATSGTEGVVSRLTFALLEDSGWYRVNYSYAEPLYWGKGLGCDFAMQSCLEWMDTRRNEGKDIAPYCDVPEQREFKCTSSRDAKGFCNLERIEDDIPPQYQYFNVSGQNDTETAKYGGFNHYADYCPYVAYEDVHSSQRFKCGIGSQPLPYFRNLLETFSKKSKCIDANVTHWVSQLCQDGREAFIQKTPVCHEYSCQDGLVHINVRGRDYPCFYHNQSLNIQLVSTSKDGRVFKLLGTLLCPPCEEMCSHIGMICNSSRLPEGVIYPAEVCPTRSIPTETSLPTLKTQPPPTPPRIRLPGGELRIRPSSLQVIVPFMIGLYAYSMSSQDALI